MSSLVSAMPNVPMLNTSTIQPVTLTEQGVRLLDQTVLPHQVVYQTYNTVAGVADAIRTMIVRGAPAIGITGAFGMVIAARVLMAQGQPVSPEAMAAAAYQLKATRPTAVNLAWAVDQMFETVTASSEESPDALLSRLTQQANQILQDDIAANLKIGQLGASLLPPGARILTHCNAGALATGGYGTALGVVRAAFAADPTVTVYADETRPRLQGARLTAWELAQDGIPVTLICDNMAAVLMRDGLVDAVVVGADRIAANGDTANKIGTYGLAVQAHVHNVPFYVAAPWSTVDLSLADGSAIPIEERDASEIYDIDTARISPTHINFYNPAFDVTPAKYIRAIVTERGVFSDANLKKSI
jgi:methylthioribose-1-phosphate isomerase